MTTEPHEAPRANWAVVKNLVGLVLLIVAVVAAITAAWFTDWRLGLAATALPVGAGGWVLATSED